MVTMCEEDYFYCKIPTSDSGQLLLRAKSINDPATGQLYNYHSGEWMDKPDFFYEEIYLQHSHNIEISYEEAMKLRNSFGGSLVDVCRSLSEMAHEGQKDKGGNPYYLHPKAVAERCTSNYAKCVAYLHDVIEDNLLIDEEFIYNFGVPKEIVECVSILTHDKSEDYATYIKRILDNPIASEVKYYDLKHNTDLTRTNGKILVSDEKWKNYQNSLKILNNKYNFEKELANGS